MPDISEKQYPIPYEELEQSTKDFLDKVEYYQDHPEELESIKLEELNGLL